MGLGEPRLTVAKMQFWVRRARRNIEQARHAMRAALLVRQALPQNHIAAAFPMDGPCPGEVLQACKKTLCGCKPFRMELRVAARQPAKVAVIWGRLIGKRREEVDFRARLSPAKKNMRIEKRKGFVLCNC